MDLLTWILVGVAVYWVAIVAIRRAGLLPASVKTTGPITTVRTGRGRDLLDRLAQRRRLWRAFANLGVGVAIVVMVGSFLMLMVTAVLTLVAPQPTEGIQQPQNVLVIPGVNDFLPLEVAPEIVLGLVVALVIHEGAHGLLCRVEDIEIESMGVAMLAFIPLGAFVEPNEDSADRASRGARTRMFAAGVTANFALTLVVFALLFGPVVGSLAVAPGAAIGGVVPGSAADGAGIDGGDRITAMEGEPVADFEALDDRLDANPDREVTVELNGEGTTQVTRSLLVTAATTGGPSEIPEGSTIDAVEGDPVHTMPAWLDRLDDLETASVSYTPPDGQQRSQEVPLGALGTVAEGALADTGLERGEQVVITRIDGERVRSRDDLTDRLDARDPGDGVTVDLHRGGDRHDLEVTLGGDDRALLGIVTTPGTTGMGLSDFGIRGYPADAYLALLGGGDPADDPIGVADSFFGKLVIAVFLPLASIPLGAVLPYNFPGFTADTTNFFVVEGALSGLGGGVFLLANALFWTGWINVNLGFFNCIPAIPLDGGHILRSTLESVVARSPVAVSTRAVSLLVGTVAVVMLASVLLMVFGTGFLG